MKHLERDRTLVLHVLGEPDGGHAAASEHALNRVGTAERGLEASALVDGRVGHVPVAGSKGRPSTSSIFVSAHD